MGKDPSDIREEIEDTRDRMSETVDAIAYKADVPGRMQDAIGGKIDDVKTSIAQATNAVREGAGSIRESIGNALPDTEAIQDQTARTISFMRENPLGLFFGAAAVGFVLGSILPVSDIENARLGPVREQLKKKAQSAGGQLIKQGQAVVRDTIEAAKVTATQSAIEHGRNAIKTAMSDAQDESQ
jgi:ElaB/YqjD/DUF883 family membrane-anchored ribosome-binding protein